MPKTRPIPTTQMSLSIPVSVWYAFRDHVPSGSRSGRIVSLIVKYLEQEGVTID